MKKLKSILCGALFMLFLLAFSSGPVNSQGIGGPGAGGESETRWLNLPCLDGSGGTYEICFYSGDGNICPIWGQRTRDCI